MKFSSPYISKFGAVIVLLGSVLAPWLTSCAKQQLPLERIHLPPGFSIEVVVDNVPNARAMVFGDDGTLFVGTRSEGKVYAIEFRDRKTPKAHTLLKNLTMPTGVAFRDGALYVAEVERILRFDDIEQRLNDPPPPTVIATLPSDRQHGWRYIAFGPDGKLYVPIGVPCNICEKEGYGIIARMNPDGSAREVFARGVRNTVGFTWHPDTGALLFTDNGADYMGNDTPFCELNAATGPGQHFGFPFCHSGTIIDPEFGQPDSCANAVAPLQNLGPHVAPLGLEVYSARQFPVEYRGDVFIAEHGSWNRDDPIGYRLTRVKLQGDQSVAYEVFAQGWLHEGRPWGRPVDVILDEGGALLVSDDAAGAIYRISFSGT